MKILYLKNETTNLGDAIQSLAAKYIILGSGNEPIPIDKQKMMEEAENQQSPLATEKYLINGWFTKHEFNKLIKKIDGNTNGILAGIHISDWYDKEHTEEEIKKRKLKLNIGCRDSGTYEQIKNVYNETWVSGCLTTTLGITFEHDAYNKDNNKALFVDIKSCKFLPKSIEGHSFTHSNGTIQTEKNAEESLKLFNSYKFIITRRLHCALPSCSMGKNVLFFGNIKDYRIEPIILSGATIKEYPSYRKEKSRLLRAFYLMQRKLFSFSRCRSIREWVDFSLKGKCTTPRANEILYNEMLNRISNLEE